MDLDTQRRRAFHQSNVIKFARQLSLASTIEDNRRSAASSRVLVHTSPSGYIKWSVGDAIFKMALMSMGTEKHQSYIDDCEDGKV